MRGSLSLSLLGWLWLRSSPGDRTRIAIEAKGLGVASGPVWCAIADGAVGGTRCCSGAAKSVVSCGHEVESRNGVGKDMPDRRLYRRGARVPRAETAPNGPTSSAYIAAAGYSTCRCAFWIAPGLDYEQLLTRSRVMMVMGLRADMFVAIGTQAYLGRECP